MPAHFCGVYAHKPSLGLVPFRGYGPPPLPPLAHGSDIAVLGPMARSAADLALALDVIAGPDEECAAIGYRLSLPPARHDNLSSFRVLVIDTHPLVPTDSAVRTAIVRLSEQLTKAGAKVGGASPLLPDLAESARLYMKLLGSSKSGGMSADSYSMARTCCRRTGPWRYRRAGRAHARHGHEPSRLARDRHGACAAPAAVATVVSRMGRHAIAAGGRGGLPHDHSLPLEARHIQIDTRLTPSSTRASSGLTRPPRVGCRRPWRRSADRQRDCPSAFKSSGLILRIARRSPLQNFLNESSAVSCRRPVTAELTTIVLFAWSQRREATCKNARATRLHHACVLCGIRRCRDSGLDSSMCF